MKTDAGIESRESRPIWMRVLAGVVGIGTLVAMFAFAPQLGLNRLVLSFSIVMVFLLKALVKIVAEEG